LAVASEIARKVGLPNITRVAALKAASAGAGDEAIDLLAGAAAAEEATTARGPTLEQPESTGTRSAD
jgi:hypothetical protein